MKLRDANLQVYEETIITSSFMYFAFIFSERAWRLLLPKSLWKSASTIAFKKCKWKVIILVIYLFNTIHLSFNVEYGIWHCLEYGFFQINWNSLFLSIQRLAYRKSWTWDPGPRTYRRDPAPGIFTLDPRPGALHLWPGILHVGTGVTVNKYSPEIRTTGVLIS